MAAWKIKNGSIDSVVDAELGPTCVFKHGGDTYVTVLVHKLGSDTTVDPRKFYEDRYNGVPQSSTGTVRKIDASGEDDHNGVNVVNVGRN